MIKFVNPAIQKISVLDESKLNQRQKKFFDRFIEGEEKITTQQYIELIGCSKRTVIRDLNQLVKLGVVVQKGSVTGRGRYYIIKVTKGDRKLCLVVKDTANRDLVDLIKKRIIKKEGIGRAVFYRLFNEADK